MTNTYDVALKPKVTAVVRAAGGVIVGGDAVAELQPGTGAQAKFSDRPVAEPRLAEATIECYADPNLGRMLTRTPIWQVI